MTGHQPALDGVPEQRPPKRWCRRCGRVLRDPVSRLRGLGAECDPARRSAGPDHQVEQDTIPGM